jgi:hypothetical protein
VSTLKSILRVVWVLLAAVTVFGCVAWLVAGFGAEPNPAKRCVGASRDGCFSREPAVVTKLEDPIHVSYEDGLRSTRIYLREESPALREGSRVWLERWDGDIVSIANRRSERRYRADDWVDRWSGKSFWAPLVWLVVSLVALALMIRSFVIGRRAGGDAETA